MASSKLDSDVEFRRLVAGIAWQLTSSNLEELYYIYHLPVQFKDCSHLSLLQELQQRGHFSSAEDLAAILRSIRREDLAQEVGEHRPVNRRRGAGVTPAQLRAKCDANIAQMNSLLVELKKIQTSLRHASLAPDASAELWYHLEEIERGAYGLLGRCENAHKCCSVTVHQSQSVPLENRVQENERTGSSAVGPLNCVRDHFIPPPAEKQQKLVHQHQHTADPPSIQISATAAPVITHGQKHSCFNLPSSKNSRTPALPKKGTKSPTSPPRPTPPRDKVDNCTKKDCPDYDEPDLTSVGVTAVEYYAYKDLVRNRKDLQTAQMTDKGRDQECPHCHGSATQSQAPFTVPPSAPNKVQTITQKRAGCPIAAAKTAVMRGLGMTKMQKGARPQVPRKPGCKSCYTIGVPLTGCLKHPSSTSTPNLAHHTSEPDMEESGYSSSSSGSRSHSAENSAAEWTKGSRFHPPSKEWPSSLPEQNYYKRLNKSYSEHANDYL